MRKKDWDNCPRIAPLGRTGRSVIPAQGAVNPIHALFLHGDDDQNVPLEISARLAVELVPNAVLKVYRGGSHGLIVTSADTVNADLLDFVKT
ncbi:protein of unknown function [Cupriavidus taiwanensis]|nr:protein of unknown function [Cupriavidus taiwanensis]